MDLDILDAKCSGCSEPHTNCNGCLSNMKKNIARRKSKQFYDTTKTASQPVVVPDEYAEMCIEQALRENLTEEACKTAC